VRLAVRPGLHGRFLGPRHLHELAPEARRPGGACVLAVLGRLDRALADAERVWDGLEPFLREGLQPPGELLEEAGRLVSCFLQLFGG
jgi:hypothetical protein